jgi:Calpain family cysteine protease
VPTPKSHNPFVEIMHVVGEIDPSALVTLWANLPPHRPGFTGDLFERFHDIDRDGDGFISLEEVDMACASKRFTGHHAAAIATLRTVLHQLQELSDDEVGWENDGVTRADLAGLDFVAHERPNDELVEQVDVHYENAKLWIEHAPRSVFPDPESPTVDPMRCRQGLMGDCFFLASLVALAHQDPGRLLAMIGRHPDRPHLWQVRFPRSEQPIKVAMPTDAEIALFSMADGSWSAIFEIAYGKQVFHDRYGALSRFETLNGGRAADAIEVLTGVPARVLELEDISMADIRARLEDAMAWDKVAVATTKKGPVGALTPDGLHCGHAYSILGFGDGVALLRDPLGDSGAGPLGEPIERGVFKLPLPCFPVNFSTLAIER